MLSNAGQLKKKNVKKICTISILRFFFSCPAGIQISDPDVTGGLESKMLTVFLLMFFLIICVFKILEFIQQERSFWKFFLLYFQPPSILLIYIEF